MRKPRLEHDDVVQPKESRVARPNIMLFEPSLTMSALAQDKREGSERQEIQLSSKAATVITSQRGLVS